MTSDPYYLVDTNILLRLAKSDRPGYSSVRNAYDTLLANGIELAFALQNMAEFWNVSTRPLAHNGFGLTIEECERTINVVGRGLTFLPDTESVYHHWRALVVQHRVSGIQVHDARLAATMLAHGLTHILTFNTADFARFDGIHAIHPSEVASS